MISVDRKDEDAFREGMGDVPQDPEYLDIVSFAQSFGNLGEDFAEAHTFIDTISAILLERVGRRRSR